MTDETRETNVTLDAVKQEAQRTAHDVADQRLEVSKRRRIDWDVRGLLALMAIVGAFTIAGVQLALKGDANIPTWAATMVGAVIGFYFGGRSSGNGSYGRRRDDR